MSPDRAPQIAGAFEPPAVRAGWLEWALPLWYRRWWLLAGMVLGTAAALAIAFQLPLRYAGQASFVVQPVLRPSQAAAGALPTLAGLIGGGAGPIDLHVAVLRSDAVSDRIIDRFELQRAWNLQRRVEARRKLARRAAFGIGRREGLVQVTVEDENPARAAAIANEYVNELRQVLRAFAADEARQRRQFYDLQLTGARHTLEAAQNRLQGSGFDRAALNTDPRAPAEAYARAQAELAAQELRLAAARRVRAEDSAEVRQLVAETAAMRGQIAKMTVPQQGGDGAFVSRLREYRQAEAVVEQITRQAEAARVDEAAEPLTLQQLDVARPPEWPSGPQPLKWLAGGVLLGFGLPAGWVLLRHRSRMARLDPAYVQRVELLRSVLRR